MVPDQMSRFVLSFLGRIVEPKIEKVIGGWRKVCDVEHHYLYSSQKRLLGCWNQGSRDVGRACGIHGRDKTCKIQHRKHVGKRSLGRPRCRLILEE